MKVRCSFCKNYVEKEEAYSRGMSNYCNEVCFGSKVRKNQKPKPRKAKTAKILPPEMRASVLGSDGLKCRGCGVRENLHLHHIVYRSQGGTDDPSNLITLCFKCHDMVHSDKKVWMPICLEIVKLREETGDKSMYLFKMRKIKGDLNDDVHH